MSGCAAGEVVDPFGGCVPGAVVGSAGEVAKVAGGAAISVLADSVFGSGDLSEKVGELARQVKAEAEEAEAECPIYGTWEKGGKVIGDGRQAKGFADDLSEKILSTAGGGPPGGSRGRALVAVVFIVLHALRHSG